MVAPARLQTLRDPWAWLPLGALALLVAQLRGTAIGEPVADDFDYLRHHLLAGMGSLFDGGGAVIYWRPLARQVYFALVGHAALDRPLVLAAVHVACLAAATVFLYRAFRRVGSGPQAAAIASFVPLAESMRMLVSWPSNFQDVGALLGISAALDARTAGRRPLAYAAYAAALLCKESAVVFAPLLAWAPVGPRGGRRGDFGFWIVLGVWAVAYVVVTRVAGLEVPAAGSAGPSLVAAPAWAVSHCGVVALGIPAAGWARAAVIAGWGAVALGALLLPLRDARVRTRVAAARPWILWGAALFLGGSLVLLPTYPLWSPYRAVLAVLGFGVGVTAWLGAVHPSLVGAMVALRVVALLASPVASDTIGRFAPATEASIDFTKLSRIQRALRETRRTLMARHPMLPRGSTVLVLGVPQGTDFAFTNDYAFQVWYRDTTLRRSTEAQVFDDPRRSVAAVVQFQESVRPEVATLAPDAMRHLERARVAIRALDADTGWRELDRAERLEPSPDARVFRAWVGAQRALCLVVLGRPAAADSAAQAALREWPHEVDARYLLAVLRVGQGRLAEAEAQLDTLLGSKPNDESGLELMRQVRALRGR